MKRNFNILMSSLIILFTVFFSSPHAQADFNPINLDWIKAVDVPNDQGGSIKISWSQIVDPTVPAEDSYGSQHQFVGYELMRSDIALSSGPTDYGPSVCITTSLSQTSCIDKNAAIGKTYYYWIALYYYLGSNTENPVNIRADKITSAISIDNIPPTQPTGVSTSRTNNELEIAWQKNSEPDLLSYSVNFYTNNDAGSKPAKTFVAYGPEFSIQLDKYYKDYKFISVQASDKNGNISTATALVAIPDDTSVQKQSTQPFQAAEPRTAQPMRSNSIKFPSTKEDYAQIGGLFLIALVLILYILYRRQERKSGKDIKAKNQKLEENGNRATVVPDNAAHPICNLTNTLKRRAMFDSKNLPLSPLKPIKKTIGRVVGKFLSGLVTVVIAVGLLYFKGFSFNGFNNSILGQILTPSIIIWAILILVILGLLILGSVFLYEYLYYKSYYYSFSDEGGEVKKGVFSTATGHVRYDKLQNVYVDQDFLDRIFGLYDVHYETAGETSGFYSHVDGLNKENSDKLIEFLNKKTGSASKSDDKGEDKQMVAHQVETIETEKGSAGLGKILISRKDCPISKNIIKARVWMIIAILLIPAAVLIPEGIWSYLDTFNGSTYDTSGSFLFVFVIMFLLLVVGTYYYYREWFKNLNYTFGVDKAEIFTKVLGQSSSYLYYDRIQNVMVNQMFLDRPFGLYTLVIETAGESSGNTLRIEGFEKENAEKVKDFLIEKSSKYRRNL